jgi:hypothetical protein
MDMTIKKNILVNRIKMLENRSQNIKSGGVLRKLRRQLRNIEK